MARRGFKSGHNSGDAALPVAADVTLIRGIYAPEEERDPILARAPKFDSKEECEAWTVANTRRTNPEYPLCKQLYTTLVDWGQLERYFLPKLEEYRRRYGTAPPIPPPPENNYATVASMLESIRFRLDLPIHKRVNEESTLNTLRYMFFHMKCGIFVMIRQNKVVLFVPFVNKDYRNLWGDKIQIDAPSVEEYYAEKAARTRKSLEHPLEDKMRWWANGNIICNVEGDNFWGDSYLPQIKDMLEQLCARRTVSDCEFFINKRDYPHLKVSASGEVTEAYEFLYDKEDVPLEREKYSTYAPIGSFFVSKLFADLPFTCTDDWETATGKVYPPAGTDIRSAKNRALGVTPWLERRSTAIFRGNSTGPGVTADDNQRIKLALISMQWATNPKYNAINTIDGIPFLDAGVVGWNFRDRKIHGKPKMMYIKAQEIPVKLVEKVPMHQQQKYKYQIYVDGHVAAMRYASMMVLGSVILKVGPSTKASDLWFFPVLVPVDVHSEAPNLDGDHIPVRADLSDLAEVISWCKTHDAECQRIVSNAEKLYQRLMSEEGQLDYLQLLTFEMASRFHSSRAGPAPVPVPKPSVAWAPFDDYDWFGADNVEYCKLPLRQLCTKPPVIPPKPGETFDCHCVRCEKERPLFSAAASAVGSGAAAAALVAPKAVVSEPLAPRRVISSAKKIKPEVDLEALKARMAPQDTKRAKK